MTTTFEPHNTTCHTCAIVLGPCEEFGCTNRYDHADGRCVTCEAEETGQEGEG